MFKNLLHAQPAIDKEKTLLALELEEIREISDMLFARIEKKMQLLEAMEASLDKKIATLERLVHRADAFRAPNDATSRPREIAALRQKGFGATEIADIVGMPLGEVSLILDLHAQHGSGNS